jgi:hypothetical protein
MKNQLTSALKWINKSWRRSMTVKKLIHELQAFNQNAEVNVCIYKEGRKPGQTIPITYIDIIERGGNPTIGFASEAFKPKNKKSSRKIIIL